MVKQQPPDEFKAVERMRFGKQRADATTALWQLGDPRKATDVLKVIVFPPGRFMMGSPEHEEGRFDDETLRKVQIERPFALCDREITNAQYRRFMASRNGDEEEYTGKPDHPTVNMSWNDHAVQSWQRCSSPAELCSIFSVDYGGTKN